MAAGAPSSIESGRIRSVSDLLGIDRIILASASPRRRELLRGLVDPLEVVAPALSEPRHRPARVSAAAWAEALAYFKARTIADTHPGAWVIGADTVVWCAGELLGKPRDADHARRMLELQSGGEAEVITGVALLRVGPDDSGPVTGTGAASGVRRFFGHAVSRVWMRDSPAFVESYLASGDWRGKAGAYGIQDTADKWIARIEGSFSNVVGLPVELVSRMLRFAWVHR